MMRRLRSGSVTPARAWTKRAAASDTTSGIPSACRKTDSTSSHSPCAEQAVVDEDAGQPVAEGAMDQGGGDGGVHTARSARRRRGPAPTWLA